MLHPQGLAVGDTIVSGPGSDIRTGNALPLTEVPLGTAVHNIELLPGDIVTVFGVNDLPVPVAKRTQYVRIAGEVQVPGVYQITPGETLEQLVRRVGGFTPNAYPYGTVFTRESTRVQQQKNLDQAIKVAAYSYTPGWLGAVLGIIPFIGWLLGFLLALYGL